MVKPASASSASAASRTHRRNRADHVAQTRKRQHADVRHEREGRLDADQPLRGSRVLDRPAGLLGEAQHREARPDRRRRSGARSSGQELAPGCVIGGARPAVVGVAAGRAQDRDIGLAQDHRAGRPHPGHDRRVGGRIKIDAARLAVQKPPAAGRRESGHVHGVLDDNRHAVEGPKAFARRAPGVARPRVVERAGVHEHDRVVRRVVDRDAIEKGLRQAFARERAAGEARLSALDRHLDDVDRARRLFRRAHDRCAATIDFAIEAPSVYFGSTMLPSRILPHIVSSR